MFPVSQHCPLLITPLVSSNFSCVPNVSSISALSIIDYTFGIFKLFLCAQWFQYLSIVHLAQGRWFSPGTPASSTTKTGRHVIAESAWR
jgi:hypothetical protein